MFAWTPALEQLVPPRRGQGPRLVGRQLGRARLFRAALKARAVGYEPRPSLVRLMRTGEGDLADEADAFLLAGSAPRRGGVGKLSGLSEAEAELVAFSGVDRWVQLHGLPTAIEIFSLLGAWTPVPLFAHEHARMLAVTRLRHWLAHADAYDAALAVARRFDGLPHGMLGWRTSSGHDAGREAIAYLFPDHRPFFDRAAEELLARGERSTLLLGAVETLSDHELIEELVGDADRDRNALVLAKQLGERALPILVRYARAAARTWPRSSPAVPSVVHALTAYDDPVAAQALALFADHPAAQPIVRRSIRSGDAGEQGVTRLGDEVLHVPAVGRERELGLLDR